MSSIGVEHTFNLGNGQDITIETGKLAKLADGSVVIKQGNTMLLATVVSAKEAKPDIDFFPLSVEYQEKYASAGRIPGGFLKREARLSDSEILVCRLVDRALRPLFPKNYVNETQIMISLISSEKDVLPDALAALAASSAIMMTDIPFSGPVSEVRVAKINGEYIVNPTRSMLENAEIDVIVAATMDDITMVEGEAKECSEEELIEAIKIGHEAIKKQCQAQIDLAQKFGAPTEKREVSEEATDEELKQKIANACKEDLLKVMKSGNANKHVRREEFGKVRSEFIDSLGEDAEPETVAKSKNYIKSLEKEVIRKTILEDRVRLDGRKLDEIRPIWIENGYLPSAHGSSVFTRGETQSLTSVTLGSKTDEQMLDKVSGLEYSRFILHYNFPAFSTGEVKPNRGPSRREIGHGNLAMRSLKKVLPADADNPYTIRVVSDILESNGSSSMATVCAGSLALMDAGVKISNAVSGIAMGLITDGDKFAVLSDILGDEDHLGDMDFKVTGTKNGICACQMDIKVDGLPYEVLSQALSQAKQGRMHILEKMNEAIDKPREDYKPQVPRVEKLMISSDMIGSVIGPGGKVIQGIQAETGATININELEGTNQAEVLIFGENKEVVNAAIIKVKGIVAIPEEGETYDAKVKSIMPYGAFVEFMPGKQGLLHVSEIDWKRVENVEDHLKEGDEIQVKLMGIDKKSGKFKLSRKVLLEKPQESTAE